MSRIQAKEAVVFCKIETTEGTYNEPAAADWVEALNINITPLEGDEVTHDLNCGELGSKRRELTGERVRMSFSVALAGSGTAGNVPNYGQLLRGCSFAETQNAGTDVVYLPVSTNRESVSMVAYIGPNKHAMKGSRGNVSFSVDKGGYLLANFEFLGIFIDPTEASHPSITCAASEKPLIAQADNTSFTLHSVSDLKLHAFSLDLGASIAYEQLLNGDESIVSDDRESSGSAEWNAYGVATKDWFAAAAASDEGTLTFTLGTVAGKIVELSCPKVQVINPDYGTQGNTRTIAVDLNVMPSTGDDDIKLTVK